MNFVVGALAGAAASFFLTRRYYNRLVEAAHTAATDARLLVDRAKAEYKNLKQGLADKLDEILGEK